MSKYRVNGMVTISIWCEVEAESPEDAKLVAMEQATPQGFCHQCSGPRHPQLDTWYTSGELDGTPELIDEEPELLEGET